MPKHKTRKAIIKRFKITKSGKMLRRPVGQDHYLAKRPGSKRMHMRKWIELSRPGAKQIKKVLYG